MGLRRHWVGLVSGVVAFGVVGASTGKARADSSAPSCIESDLQKQRLGAVERVLLHLNAQEKDVSMLPEVYRDDARFVDPLFPEGLVGVDALRAYHQSLNGRTESFDVVLSKTVVDGNSVWVEWQATAVMAFRLDLGEALRRAGLPTMGLPGSVTPYRLGPIQYDGVTRFDFRPCESKIAVHRDYYDGSALFEKMPMVGSLLGTIKEQVRKSLQR